MNRAGSGRDGGACAATARLFLAAWPTPAVRRALVEHQQAWRWCAGAALVPPANLHLTLHFLGAVARERIPDLIAGLGGAAPVFDLRLGLDTIWPHGVAVLQPRTVPEPLLALHEALREGLQRLDVATDARPYRPHVTLARRCSGSLPPPAPAPVRWRVRGHALVESAGGYVRLHDYRGSAGGAG